MILPVFFWDFGSGSPANGPGPGTMIATSCDQLQIFINGTQVATGTPGYDELRASDSSAGVCRPHLSGAGSPELRIDGYRSGQKVASLSMSSDTTQDRLSLTVEDASINGDGSDTTRFTFRALNKYGNQRPYPTGDVTLTASGPATLIAENPSRSRSTAAVAAVFCGQRSTATARSPSLHSTRPSAAPRTTQILRSS